jgi:GntR family transcriptional regulator, transcriptional repressor for pyruvate dehydrogenase complex
VSGTRSSAPAVEVATRTLREEALHRPVGHFLGSEDELVQRLGVSRPTFRQAARVLAREQLITIKRGAGGGFFVRQPSTESVFQTVLTYLQSRHTSELQILEANAPLVRIALHSAASSRNRLVRRRLEKLQRSLQDEDGFSAQAEQERALAGIVGALCGNPAVALYMHLFNWLASKPPLEAPPGVVESPEFAVWQRLRRQIIQAILDHDGTAAVAAYEYRTHLVVQLIRSAKALESLGN